LQTEKAGWGSSLPAGQGRGVSLQHAFGSYLAQVAQVEVTRDGTVRVKRIVCAVDCGVIINPDIVAAQMEGGAIFGLTGCNVRSDHLENGRVKQGNFNTYRPIRMNEAPVVETHLVKSTEAPGGIGEAGTSIVAPAVDECDLAATGKRIRTLPIINTAIAAPSLMRKRGDSRWR